jgi:hypothetical protein
MNTNETVLFKYSADNSILEAYIYIYIFIKGVFICKKMTCHAPEIRVPYVSQCDFALCIKCVFTSYKPRTFEKYCTAIIIAFLSGTGDLPVYKSFETDFMYTFSFCGLMARKTEAWHVD